MASANWLGRQRNGKFQSSWVLEVFFISLVLKLSLKVISYRSRFNAIP
jgi:hypothetical protein